MSKSPRPVARRFAGALLVLAFLAGCGIFRELGVGGDDPKWLERKFDGVSATTALQLAQTVLRDRYPPSDFDLYRGTLETGWIYGRYEEQTHKALRQRVRVETESDLTSVTVRLRVQQEASESGGRAADATDQWEPADDDVQEAKTLLTRLGILMKDVATEPPAAAPAR